MMKDSITMLSDARYLTQQQPEVEFQSFHKMRNDRQTMKCNTCGNLAGNHPHCIYEEVHEPRFASYLNSSRVYWNPAPIRNSSKVYGNLEPVRPIFNVFNEAMYEPRCESQRWGLESLDSDSSRTRVPILLDSDSSLSHLDSDSRHADSDSTRTRTVGTRPDSANCTDKNRFQASYYLTTKT